MTGELMGLLSNIYSTMWIQNILLPCDKDIRMRLMGSTLKRLHYSVDTENLTDMRQKDGAHKVLSLI